MNERLPYEEQLVQQLSDLPLPDENMAWADMKGRLEKDDKDRFIPFWLRGCFLWILFGILLLSLGWWIIRPEKWFKKKKTEQETFTSTQTKEREMINSLLKTKVKEDSNKLFRIELKQPSDSLQNSKVASGANKRREQNIVVSENNNIREQTNVKTKKRKSELNKKEKDLSKIGDSVVKTIPEDKNKNTPDENTLENQNQIADSNKTVPYQTKIAKANTEKMKADSLQQKDEVAQPKEQKRKSPKTPKISFAVGFSLQQQLPINGQKLVPYNFAGRKGSLTDYIPSAYLRIYKKNKWFMQSEFRYGAPQYTKEFLYKQNIYSSQLLITTTSTRLKKTFYHQLPVTFNYFISKNLSFGGGIVWNRFVSAISARDIIQHNNLTGTDSVISKGTILRSKISDSGNVFVNSYFQVLLEAQYKWERFSLGAKYALGLRPYIRFKLPAGVLQQEKNSSINLFLRYELWRSKKK